MYSQFCVVPAVPGVGADTQIGARFSAVIIRNAAIAGNTQQNTRDNRLYSALSIAAMMRKLCLNYLSGLRLLVYDEKLNSWLMPTLRTNLPCNIRPHPHCFRPRAGAISAKLGARSRCINNEPQPHWPAVRKSMLDSRCAWLIESFPISAYNCSCL